MIDFIVQRLGKLFSRLQKSNFLVDILIFCLLLLLFNLGNSGGWYFSDSARDLEEVFGMVGGDWRLLGPKLSFFGLFSGPYYYYYLYPLLRFFSGNPHNIIFVHTIVVIILMMMLFKKFTKKYSSFGFLFFLFIVTTPSVLIVARNISNGLFIFFPFVLSVMVLLKDETNWKGELFLGLLAGIMVNSHPITLIAAGELWMILLFRSKNKLYTSLRYVSMFLITFLPIWIFEIRHDWILLKSIEMSQIGVKVKDWRLFFNERLALWPHLINIVVLISIFFHSLKDSGISLKLKKKLSFVLYFNILVIFMIIFYRPSSYYLFVYIWLIAFFSGYVFLKSNQKKKMMILSCCINVCLVIVLFSSSSKSNDPTWYKQKVERVIERGWFHGEKNNNIMVIRKAYSTAPQGYEYRYFAKIMDKNLLSADDFANTERLIIFSEDPDFDFQKEKSFEMSQFKTAKTRVDAKFSDKDLTYLLLIK